MVRGPGAVTGTTREAALTSGGEGTRSSRVAREWAQGRKAGAREAMAVQRGVGDGRLRPQRARSQTGAVSAAMSSGRGCRRRGRGSDAGEAKRGPPR